MESAATVKVTLLDKISSKNLQDNMHYKERNNVIYVSADEYFVIVLYCFVFYMAKLIME